LEIKRAEKRGVWVGEVDDVCPRDVLCGVGAGSGVNENLAAVVNDVVGFGILVPFWPPTSFGVGLGAVVGMAA